MSICGHVGFLGPGLLLTNMPEKISGVGAEAVFHQNDFQFCVVPLMPDQRDLLLQEALGLQELDLRRQECPIAAFKPHPLQQKCVESTSPITIMTMGNRGGKTTVAVAELIAAALGYRPWLVPGFKLVKTRDGWDFPPRSQVPASAWVRRLDGLPIAVPNKCVFVSGLSLGRGIAEVAQEKWMHFWPRQVPFKIRHGSEAWQKVTLPNGSEVYFGSALQSGFAWEGFASHFIAMDEPIPQRVYVALRRGLVDNKGRIVWTMTPLGDTEMAWVAADLIRDDRPDVTIITGSSYDNPYMPKDSLDALFDDPALTQDDLQARKYGRIAMLGSRIVTTFTDDCIIPSTELDLDIPRIQIVDPHHAKPPAIIWAGVMDDGERLVIYREYPEADFEKAGVPATTCHRLAGIIKEAEGKERLYWRVCDPHFGPQHAKVLGETYRSFVEEMAEYDLLFDTRVDTDLDRTIQTLRDAFRISGLTKRPKIQVMRHCSNTIKALKFWAYTEREGKRVPSEKFKDFCDVVRMLAAYSPVPYTQEGGYNYLDWAK